jgi:hypothetical protein
MERNEAKETTWQLILRFTRFEGLTSVILA